MTTAIELKDPVASDPVPDPVENILGAAQYMSATYWFNEAAKMVCGTDPMSWIAAQFAGDWEAIQRAGIAISTLGDFNEDYSSLIDRDIIGLSSYWTGGAADEASKYLLSTATRSAARQMISRGSVTKSSKSPSACMRRRMRSKACGRHCSIG
ncbi:hypothetical protein GS935_08930 [Rhodococcus hoagii]|nr:hypothetical protein [Prescottella equi]